MGRPAAAHRPDGAGHATALYAAQCVGAALYARDAQAHRGGRGRHLRLSLAECCAAFQAGPILDDFLFAGQYQPPITVPAGVFATRDGHVVLAVLARRHVAGPVRALARADWLTEPRYATGALRGQCAEEINSAVADILRGRDTRNGRRCSSSTTCCSHRCRITQPCATTRRCATWATSARPIRRLTANCLCRTSPAPAQRRAARGAEEREHSRAILAEFGYGAAEIEALEQTGLVIQAS